MAARRDRTIARQRRARIDAERPCLGRAAAGTVLSSTRLRRPAILGFPSGAVVKHDSHFSDSASAAVGFDGARLVASRALGWSACDSPNPRSVRFQLRDHTRIDIDLVALLPCHVPHLTLTRQSHRVRRTRRDRLVHDRREIADAFGEPLLRSQSRGIDHDEEVPDLLLELRLVDPRVHAREVLGAREHAGEEIDHQRKAIALVATEGQQEPIDRGAWIRRGLAVLVGGPCVGNGAAGFHRVANLRPGHDAHRHVEDDWIGAWTRNSDRERIVANLGLAAASRCDRRRGVAAHDARESLLRRDVAVRAARAEVIAVAGERDADSILARRGDRGFERAHADRGTHAVVAIDSRHAGCDRFNADVRLGPNPADGEALAVRLHAAHAMRVMAEKVAENENARGVGGILTRDAQAHERIGRELLQLLGLHSGVIFASRTTLLHFSVSRSMYWASSSRVPGIGIKPCLASSVLIVGSFSAFTSSRFQKSRMSFGVLAGATNAYQFIASNPG